MQVNELIDRANKEWDELHPDEDESERLLPLIRLRVRLLPPSCRHDVSDMRGRAQVDYSHGPDGNSYFDVGNPQRFGQDFVDKVANPRDIVQFHRKAATRELGILPKRAEGVEHVLMPLATDSQASRR